MRRPLIRIWNQPLTAANGGTQGHARSGAAAKAAPVDQQYMGLLESFV